MRKLPRQSRIVVILVTAIVILLLCRLFLDLVYTLHDRSVMVKSDAALLGRHFTLQRDSDPDNPIDLNLYLRSGLVARPLIINLHGGTRWVGDADLLDTQSLRLSNDWNVHVATINYSMHGKTDGVMDIVDTVQFFIDHAENYTIDTNRIFLLGYGRGGYYAMASAMALTHEGIYIRGQILCYPQLQEKVIQNTWEALSEEERAILPATLFVLAGDDEATTTISRSYANRLDALGVPTKILSYYGAKYGFLEENNPEYENLHGHNSTSDDQVALMYQAEDDIGDWIIRQR